MSVGNGAVKVRFLAPNCYTRIAGALEEQEESDSEGQAVKKYRTMLTTDRGAFDKEATRFLRNLRGQGNGGARPSPSRYHDHVRTPLVFCSQATPPTASAG